MGVFDLTVEDLTAPDASPRLYPDLGPWRDAGPCKASDRATVHSAAHPVAEFFTEKGRQYACRLHWQAQGDDKLIGYCPGGLLDHPFSRENMVYYQNAAGGVVLPGWPNPTAFEDEAGAGVSYYWRSPLGYLLHHDRRNVRCNTSTGGQWGDQYAWRYWSGICLPDRDGTDPAQLFRVGAELVRAGWWHFLDDWAWLARALPVAGRGAMTGPEDGPNGRTLKRHCRNNNRIASDPTGYEAACIILGCSVEDAYATGQGANWERIRDACDDFRLRWLRGEWFYPGSRAKTNEVLAVALGVG